MTLVRWEPFRELAALQSELGRWMSQTLGGMAPTGNGHSSTWLPAVDAWETEQELVLAFDLPGIERDQITIELEENILTVSGQREQTQEQSGERFYRFERRYGTFARSVTLPQGVDENKIHAECKNGVLEVRIPKPEQSKPKRIQVTGMQPTIEGKSMSKE